MQAKLETSLRHAITFLPGLGAFLVSKGWLTGDEGSQLDAAFFTFLSTVAAVLAAVVTRLLMILISKHFPGLEGLLGDRQQGSVKGILLMLAGSAFLIGGSGTLTSCSVAYSAATGLPPNSVTVQRAGQPGAQPVEIEAGDLARAEAASAQADEMKEPRPVYATVDIGRAASAVREVFGGSSK